MASRSNRVDQTPTSRSGEPSGQSERAITYLDFEEAKLSLWQYFSTNNVRLPQVVRLTPIPANYTALQEMPKILFPSVEYRPRLPFYGDVEAIVPPVHLRSIMSAKRGGYFTGLMRFDRPPEQRVLAHMPPSSRTDLLIRFFKLDGAHAAQLDTFPPNVTVVVKCTASTHDARGNQREQQPFIILQQPDVVQFKKMQPKHEKPIIIPASVALVEPLIDIAITYTPEESDCEFAVGIFRARTVTVEQEVAAVRVDHISLVQTKQAILDELKRKPDGDADFESAGHLLSVPLKCPISKSRIKVPCRAAQCPVNHVCDAFSFLNMNFERPTWRCWCGRDMYLTDLRYDEFVAMLLTAHDTEDAVCFMLNDKGDDLKIKLKPQRPTSAIRPPTKFVPVAQGKNKAWGVAAQQSKNNSSNRTHSVNADLDATICLSSGDEDDEIESNVLDQSVLILDQKIRGPRR